MPPLTPSVRVMVAPPTQTTDGPDIVPAVTVVPMLIAILAVAVPQPVVTVYIIVSRPADTGVTTPELLIVARPLVIDQVPPDTVLE